MPEITYIMPINGRKNTFEVKIEIVAIIPPRYNEPVSPINTLAEKVLYTKKPINAPDCIIHNRAKLSISARLTMLPLKVTDCVLINK